MVLHANPFLQAHTDTLPDGTWRLGVAGKWSGEGDLNEAGEIEAACSIPVKVGECFINEINIYMDMLVQYIIYTDHIHLHTPVGEVMKLAVLTSTFFLLQVW